MARIPEFQQQRLASSVIGTPGVDPTAGFNARLIGDTAGKAADFAFNVAEKRANALAAANANKRLVEFEIGVGDVREATKAEFSTDPKQGELEFNNRSFELFNSILGQSSDSRANRIFSQAGSSVLDTEKKQFAIFRRNQEVVVAKDQLVDANNLLAMKANSIGESDGTPAGLQQMFDLIDNSQRATAASEIVLGVKEARNLSKLGPESIARGYLEGLIKTNPEFAIETLNNPELIKIFDDFEEVTSLEDAALRQINDLDKQSDRQLTKQQGKTHFKNILALSNDTESISDDEIEDQVDTGTITPNQGIQQKRLKDTPPNRKDVFSVRAEGYLLLSTGDLTLDWITENASKLSAPTMNSLSDSLTINLTKTPAFRAAYEQIDAEIEEVSFGFRTPEDDKLMADAKEAVRIDSVVNKRNPLTVAQEQIKIIREIKAKSGSNRKINVKARFMKRRMGGVVTPQKIAEERRRIEERLRKRQMSRDEAETAAEALEILDTEVFDNE